MEECQSALLRNLCEVFGSCCNCKGHGERDRHTEQNSFTSWIQFVCNQNEWLWKDQFTCNITHLDHWYIICSCPPIKLTFLHTNGEKTQSYIRLSWNQADTTSSNANQAFKSVEIKASLPGGEMYHHQEPRSHLLGFLHNKREREREMPDCCRGRTRKQKITPPPESKRLAQTRPLHCFFSWEKTKEEEKRGEVFSLPFHKRKKPNTATATACRKKANKQTSASR